MSETALRERLARLGAPARPRLRVERAMPRGFEIVLTPYGEALLRQDVIPLPSLDPNPGSVAYVDTETTGLSGGAGTYVFAAAVARPIDCGLRVAQVFLPQPGMEAAFLHALQAEIEPAQAVATFNGSSFDLPVLRTRWVMASRMPGELLVPPARGPAHPGACSLPPPPGELQPSFGRRAAAGLRARRPHRQRPRA